MPFTRLRMLAPGSLGRSATMSSSSSAAGMPSTRSAWRGSRCASEVDALSPKRRLVVLPSGEASDAPPRPRWQWVVFGALLILAVWLPLAYAAEGQAARILDASLAKVWPQALTALPLQEQARLGFILFALPTSALAVAASVGGYVLGRWGVGVRVREAAGAGALAALFPVVVGWTTSGWSWAPLGALLVAVPLAAVGARVGARGRFARLL